ncbi:hypothetical protein MUU72_26375 [Streptomyces sp. RS10V-4]|uniref:hypothetical protein n=1 Tax=Streptomyces rhizoryzae TaxID=2932493 RepID=UPI0020051927|nr:hypothetical protein [Streptomyces rhizoryzae]MCK7626584.1 hypothetical protein [Streptomyces rhizoryzae]
MPSSDTPDEPPKVNNPPPTAGPPVPPYADRGTDDAGRGSRGHDHGSLKFAELARRKARQAMEKLRPHPHDGGRKPPGKSAQD